MAITPVHQSTAANQVGATTSAPANNRKAADQTQQTQQDKVTISGAAKQASAGNGAKVSGGSDTDHDSDSH